MKRTLKITIRVSSRAWVEIHAKRWRDAWEACYRMIWFLKKAERTARHMELVNELSSQCMQEWEKISHILRDDGEALGPDGQQEAEPSSHPSEETAAGSEDK